MTKVDTLARALFGIVREGVPVRQDYDWESHAHKLLKVIEDWEVENAQGDCEVRRNEDGTLDEVVASNCWFHLEQMDDDHWWMRVETSDGAVTVNLGSKKPIHALCEEE